MTGSWRPVALFLVTAPLASGSSGAAPPPPVVWFDDFLGITLDPRYVVEMRGTGSVAVSSERSIGGSVQLRAGPGAAGTSRLLLGCSADLESLDARNWSARRDVVMDVRLMTEAASGFELGVGLVAPGQGDAAIAAVYPSDGSGWRLSTRSGGRTATQPTAFKHSPGQWLDVQIATAGSQQRSARLMMGGAERALARGDIVPGEGLFAELRLTNRAATTGRWPEAAVWVDYIHLQQKR